MTAGGGIGSGANAVDIDGAGVGQEQNSLQADLGVPGVGRLFVDSADSVNIMEVDAALNVLKVTAATGTVTLTVNDSALLNENLNMVASGETQLGAAIAQGLISAPGAVNLYAGDDVNVTAGTLITSGMSVLIQGDYATGVDPDPDHGTTIDIQGDVQAPTVTIAGGDDIDYPADRQSGRYQRRRYDDRARQRRRTTACSCAPSRVRPRSKAMPERTASTFPATRTRRCSPTGGVYDDDTAPFDRLTGDLANLGGLIIDTGDGGNQGTRDAIYISSDASSGPLTGGARRQQRVRPRDDGRHHVHHRGRRGFGPDRAEQLRRHVPGQGRRGECRCLHLRRRGR